MKTQSRVIQRGISHLLLLVVLLPASAGIGILASPQAASAEEEGESIKRRPFDEKEAGGKGEEAWKKDLADLAVSLGRQGIAMNEEGIREYLLEVTPDGRKLWAKKNFGKGYLGR